MSIPIPPADLLAMVLPSLLPHLNTAPRLMCLGGPEWADVITQAIPQATVCTGEPSAAAGEHMDACLLLGGEVATRGINGPVLLAEAIACLRPGGLIAALVPSQRFLEAKGEAGGLLASALDHALRERGLDVLSLSAPGVGARMAGRAYDPQADRAIDRTPGLLDAGEWILGVAQTWRDSDERTANFFASLPQRLAAASAICQHPTTGALLCVFDNFKQQWTLPGGVVDKHESPQDGAIRECLEEAGIAVIPSRLAGVFSHSDPDRLHFMYFCDPEGEVNDSPVTAHPHEIDAVAWLPLDEAQSKLSPAMWAKVAMCRAQPGQTWPFGVGD